MFQSHHKTTSGFFSYDFKLGVLFEHYTFYRLLLQQRLFATQAVLLHFAFVAVFQCIRKSL